MHATIILLPSIVLAYDMVCPDRSQRLLRSQGLCINKNNTKSVYTCLEDVNKEAFVESCSEEEDAVRPGRRYVIKGRTTGDQCYTHRYQPMKFLKTSGAICIYLKSMCTEVGQVVARNGSSIDDTTCICGFAEGYAYVTKPRDVCNCMPSEEDCSCYEKLCPENHLLSADNECIHKNATSLTKCATIDKSGKDVTTTRAETKDVTTTIKTFTMDETEVKNASIYVTVLTVICVLICVGIWYKCTRCTKYLTKKLPKSLECIEGDNVELSCVVRESNIPAYWSKDGIICQQSAKYKTNGIGNRHTLSIIQLSLQDAGDYSVTIGKIIESLSVQVKEYFTMSLVTRSCIEGEHVQFECEVLDDNETAIWFKDGIKVSTSDIYKVERQGKRHRLVINNTKIDDNGDYSVKIKNCIRQSKLIVQEYFTKSLVTRSCIEGEHVQFECEVLDDNETAIWFKDGIKVSTSDIYKVERQGKRHRLVINNTKIDDNGDYSVKIKNCIRQSKLIVQEYFTKSLVTRSCIEGEHVQFECEVLDDNETAIWFKDGIKVSTSDIYKVERQGKRHRLVIKSTKIDDNGDYSVGIKNCIRQSKLIVQEYFSKALDSQACIEGENVQFECEVLDDNQPALWLKDGIRVSTSDKYKVKTHGKLHRLIVKKTKLDDEGEYTVKIKNCFRLSKLTVREYFTKALNNQASIVGENVQFECEVLDSNQTAHWYKDGIEVSTSDKYKVERHRKCHRLIVNSTTLEDKGEYSVSINHCVRLSKLIVREIPAAIRQLSEEEKGLYLEIIKSTMETRYYIRIIIIGENGVGKTCLLRRLHGESIENVQSTDGIDVVHRCKIRLHDGQWVIDKDIGTNKKDILTRINMTLKAKISEDNHNPSGISNEGEQTRVKINSKEVIKLSATSTGEEDKMETEQSTPRRDENDTMESTELSTSSKDKRDKIETPKPSTLSQDKRNKMDVPEPSTSNKGDKDKMKITKPSTPSIDDKDKMKITVSSTLSTDDKDEMKIIEPSTPSIDDKDKMEVTEASTPSTDGKDKMEVTVPSTPRTESKDKMEVTVPSTPSTHRKDEMEVTVPSTASTDGKDKMEVPESSTPSRDSKDKMEVTKPSPPSTHGKDKMEVTVASTPSTDGKDKMKVTVPSMFNKVDKGQTNGDALSLPENQLGKSFFESDQLQKTEKKSVTRLEKILTETILNELSQVVNEKEKYDNPNEVLVDCAFWDFAGQRQYYPTHPIFLNRNAVHLLVADIMKDIKQINTEVGYDKIGEYIDFWFDSIHSCRDVEDTKNFTGEYLNPPVIVVCTGIDKCKDKLENRKNDFRKQLQNILCNEDKRKHLRRICYISNTEPSDEDLDNLRKSIFEFGEDMETFGENLPLRWIRLEQALDILCDSGVNILSWPDITSLASEYSIQDEDEVSLFLKYHHKIGSIIYFENLKDQIILNQKWLADAFQCFISDKFDEDLKLTEEWQTLENTGELKPYLIANLFQKEPKREFYKHKDHLLKVMEMFGIIVKLKDNDELSVWTYYMPCAISNKNSIKQIYDVFGVKRDKCTQTPWLSIEFKFMPFDFFNHILFHYIRKYSVCTEASTRRVALYHGIGVFFIDNTNTSKFIVAFSKNGIAMQIWQWRKLEQGKCKSMLEELTSVIHNVKNKYEPRRVAYTVKIKCADGDIHIPAGRCSFTALTELEGKEYFCEEHNEMHETRDFFQTWLEEYKENLQNPKGLSAEKTAPVLAVNTTPLMEACRKGDLSIAKHLIGKGADYKAIDSTNNTVFFWSCHGGNVDIIDFLITKGCDIHKPNNSGKTPLMEACAGGHLSAFKHLIGKGADYKASDSTGCTVFYWSCVGGNVDIIDFLIAKGCDIHKPNNSGKAPLMEACAKGHLSAFKHLIEKGANYKVSDSTGRTVFSWSCVGGNVDILDFLIAKGCDIHKPNNSGKTPLTEACAKGHLSAFKHLIEKGADYKASDSTGCTVFYWSCVGGNVDIIDFLIAKGSDIHKPNNSGKTPLKEACAKGHLSAFKHLIEKGADYKASDSTGRTVFSWSCVGGNVDILDFLIAKGCDIHKPNNSGKTPLIEACAKGHLSAFKHLIEKGADYKASDSTGCTVFSWSCVGGNVDIIDFLIAKGSDIHKPNNSGKTPLMEACAKGHLSAFKHLIEKGADYKASDSTGRTVFSWSCVGGNVDIIDFLIAKGCDIHKPYNSGKTPLMEACAKGHLSAFKHLIEKGADYKASDSTGCTVFYRSCVGGNVDIIDFLIAKGSDIHKPNISGITPLMKVCAGGHLSAFKHLIEKGADYKASDSTGRTVFSWSCVGGNVDIIDFLIAKGSDIHKPNISGITPLMKVCAGGHLSAFKHLIEKGADYKSSDSTGCTVFSWSCVGGNVDIIDFLIAKGCDIHKPNISGKTPLMEVCAGGHLSAFKHLIEKGADYNAVDSSRQTVFYWSRVGGNVKIIDFLISKGCDVEALK